MSIVFMLSHSFDAVWQSCYVCVPTTVPSVSLVGADVLIRKSPVASAQRYAGTPVCVPEISVGFTHAVAVVATVPF